jgi:hypothetical protein
VTPDAWMLAAAVVVAVLLAWAFWTLTRLRRLEHRVERAWIALDTQLQRRVGLAEELAREYPGALGEDRAARLAAAAVQTRTPDSGDREAAENALGTELRDLPAELPGVPTALQNDLAGTATRVGLARRFYNDAVRDTRELRRSRLTRWLRVHATRPLPRFFDIDARLDDAGTGAGSAPQSGR